MLQCRRRGEWDVIIVITTLMFILRASPACRVSVVGWAGIARETERRRRREVREMLLGDETTTIGGKVNYPCADYVLAGLIRVSSTVLGG